jgi:hypothetical protein
VHVLNHFKGPLKQVIEGRLLIIPLLTKLLPCSALLIAACLHFLLRNDVDDTDLLLIVELLQTLQDVIFRVVLKATHEILSNRLVVTDLPPSQQFLLR